MTPQAKQALHYVRNTEQSVTIAQFDDDHEPIGPMLREEIIPLFVIPGPDGKLKLTQAGLNELK
jgi:hypothetical protein